MGDLMSRFALDYSSLANQLTKRAYKLSDVKDQLETVAFDIVRFRDNDKSTDLWQVQSADDGEYIVALYQPDEEEKTAALWNVRVNKIANSLEVVYKGDPLVIVSASRMGIPRSELEKVPSYLPEKLTNNKKLVKALLSELSDSSRQTIFNKYPELV
jgi:hypothetical protein